MKSYKVKLKVKSEALRKTLKKTAGLYRTIYNLSLEFLYHRFIVNRNNRYVGSNKLRNSMSICKDGGAFPHLKEVDGGIYYAATTTATNAFRMGFNYHVDTIPFMSRKKGQMKFKTKGNVRVFHDYIVIPKIGKVKLWEKGRIPIGKKYKNITFIHDGNDWFITLEVEEAYKKEELSEGSVTLDFTQDGDIILNNEIIQNPTKSEEYLKTQRRLKRLTKKLKRQTKQNTIKLSETRAIPRTTRNMIKTKRKLDKLKNKLYNKRKDAYSKLVCEVARTKSREFRILPKSLIRTDRNAYLTRQMREADSKSLLNMMKKRMELIGANIVYLDSVHISRL